MITKMKKKFASCIAIVCAIMILIGIFPTNIFGSSNTVDAVDDLVYQSGYIYFDVSNMVGKGHNESEWISRPYIYIYCESWGNWNQMGKITDTLYGIDISSWVNKGASGNLIFATSNNWDTIKAANYRRTSLAGYTIATGENKIFSWNGTSTETIDNKLCFRLSVKSTPIGQPINPKTSFAGKPIYVKDMVGDARGVTATFYASEQTSAAPITQSLTLQNNHLYSTTIPNDYSSNVPYDTVEISYTTADGTYSNNVKYGIMGKGNSISNSYFNYDENNCNTYYIRAYGDDEEAERKTSCYWERPLKTTSLYSGVYAGTGAYRLYFDSEYFNDGSATIEFGYGGDKVSETTLLHDDTAGMYYYEITSPPTLTQEDIITVTSGGKKYRMFWFDMNSNIATVTTLSNPNGTAAFISDLYRTDYKRIYFDATMSKLSYEGDDSAVVKTGMGASEMYYISGTSSSIVSSATTKKMTKAAPYSKGKNTWNDVYYCDIPVGDTYICFGADNGRTSTYGRHTGSLKIPDLKKPCYYADSSDAVIYGGGSRDGYWDEVYTIRDAEKGKESKDVVDIAADTFTKDPDKLYVDTTFYDYYSDYELNGNNRDTYNNPAGASYRNWYIYRQFNQALSDYYRENNVQDPLYEGHFQPDYWAKDSDAYRFSKISNTLGLYGFDDYYRFISNNNSLHSYDGGTYNTGSNAFAYVTQGLANNKLINGKINTYGSDTTVIPFFNEDFLSENNSKNAKLGDVYKNVSFPFTKEKVETSGGGTVDYWTFDASETTLEMRNDSGKYFLKDVGSPLPTWSYNWGSGGASSTEDGRKAVHGFFPFNGTSNGNNSATYNYGYGMKMEFQFRLTEDGKVLDSNKKEAPIRFEFSGDDDVWVYIDGNLVLDLGGQHGKAKGTIDFSNNTSTVSAVKPSYNSSKQGTNVTNKFSLLNDNTTDGTISHKTTTEHTLVMYYMERGQWESNMRVQFNFPDNNELEVEKNVEYEGIVNPMFYDFFKNNSNFAFTIQNYATHYGTVPVNTATFDTATTFASAFNSFVAPTDTSTKANIPSDSGLSETVIHWSSTAENNNRTQTDSRLVTINPDSGGTVSAKDCEYMRFKIKPVSSGGGSGGVSNTLALSKMYIRFTDQNGNTARGYLTSSRLMGVPDIKADEFSIVRVLFDKLNTDKGVVFDWEHIESIGFQYDDPADIYISEFIFQPQPKLNESTGFVTNQYEIPDYGSVAAGGLTNVTGAVYTTDNATPTDTGDDNLRVVGTDSQFFLKNNETVTFSDQFRRGSYIYLNEELTTAQDALFDTTYTVYEDGKPVNTFVNTNNVINGTTITNLVKKSGTSVEDDRTEKYATGTVDGQQINNTGYTYDHQPADNSFVFRSYLTNESGTGAGSLTKLKVVYTNTAKVSQLDITKAADIENGSKPLDGTYQFYVEFYDVGGVALEDDTIIYSFTLKEGETKHITGIPVGTQFTIHEVQPTDGSSLKNVEYSKDSGDVNEVTIKNDTITVNEGGTDKTYNTRSVSGSIDEEGSVYTYEMLNYKYTVMVEIEKNWANTTSIDPLDISEVKFQLQRREKVPAGQPAKTWEDVEVITVSKNSETGAWDKKGIGGPYDFYVGNDPSNNPYEYRVLELSKDETVVADGKTYKYDDMSFNVTYDPETAYVEESSPPVNNTLKFTVTNTYVETIEYNAVKEWYDEKGTNLTAPDEGTQLTLKLQSTTNDSAGATDWKDEKTVTVNFDGTQLTLDPSVDDVECSLAVDPTNVNSKWKVVFKNLPEKDTAGVTYRYRIIEDESSMPAGYIHKLPDTYNDATNTYTIQNKKESSVTDYKVTKQWPDGLPEDGSEITLQLQQTTENTPLEGDWGKATATNNEIVIKYESGGITVKKSDGSFGTDTNLTSGFVDDVNEWYYRWNNLPATDDSSGKKIQYRVVETVRCKGYSPASQTYNETESVIVNKKVVEMPSAGSIPFIFNFALFGGIVIAISLVILHLNRKFNIFQRIMRNFKGV